MSTDILAQILNWTMMRSLSAQCHAVSIGDKERQISGSNWWSWETSLFHTSAIQTRKLHTNQDHKQN